MNTGKILTAILFFSICSYAQYQLDVSGSGRFTGNLDISQTVTISTGNLVMTNGIVRVRNWSLEAPDYVFGDYKLPDLKEVEKYVKENKHLPEIPSASSMKKDGLDLTEMNLKLLKKVEELTLYLIDENKKNEEQGKKIEMLEKMLEDKK